MRRGLIGLALIAIALGGIIVFAPPIETYTVQIVGSGEQAGHQVEIKCDQGEATGDFVGDERAESECRNGEDDEKTGRLLKLAIAGVVGVAGLFTALSGFRSSFRDFRSRVEYRRLVKAHDRPDGRRRGRRRQQEQQQ